MSPGRHGISDQEKPEPRGKVYGRGGGFVARAAHVDALEVGVYSGGLL